MRQLTFRVFISILTFTLGIAASILWLTQHSAQLITSADGERKPSASAVENGQPEWKKIDMDGKATFYVPADMRSIVLDAASPYRAFRRKGMDIALFYPNIRVGGTCINHNEENLSKYKVKKTKVADRDATILTLEVAVFDPQDLYDPEPLKGMTICVPNMGDGEHEFSILARYKNEQDYQDI